MKLILLGAPGAGKGTQGSILSKRMGIPTISTGSILRDAVRNDTPEGRQASVYMDAGALVPDELVLEIITGRLAQADCRDGFILDGVPRNLLQAEYLERAGLRFDAVLSFEITDEEIIARMSGRRVCSDCGATYHIVHAPPKAEGKCDKCGGELLLRADDHPETVKHRLEVYHAETEPLKEFYRKQGNLRTVEGRASIEETTEDILRCLAKK